MSHSIVINSIACFSLAYGNKKKKTATSNVETLTPPFPKRQAHLQVKLLYRPEPMTTRGTCTQSSSLEKKKKKKLNTKNIWTKA